MKYIRARLIIFAFAIYALAILPACTTISKEDCQNVNWYQVGVKDGQNGWNINSFQGHGYQIKSCSQQGVEQSKNKYLEGQAEGLKNFCSYESGLMHGDRGDHYDNVCPKNLQESFLQGYNLGKQRYDLRVRQEQLDDREAALNKKEAELHVTSSQTSQIACTFNSDCVIKRECRFGKCGGDGKSCTFDSDCSIKGSCTLNRCAY